VNRHAFVRLSQQLHSTRSWAEARGATSTEYALIIGLIAAVIVVAVTFLGLSTQGLFDDTATSVSNAINPA
jgi:Flp pilus assembly pilin Flp